MNEKAANVKLPLRVLHLEDNPVDAELIRMELERAAIPCAITRVYSRREFEAALQKGDVDVILSDSQLPSFDTLKALTRTREVRPDVPFVFVSGTKSPSIKTNAFFRGAAGFIEKDELPRLSALLVGLFLPDRRYHGDTTLPEVGTAVIVRCEEFACLGFLDREGHWRDYIRSTPLEKVIDWSDL